MMMLVGKNRIERRERLLLSAGLSPSRWRGPSQGRFITICPMETSGPLDVDCDGKAYRQFLNPGEAPEATFNISAQQVTAREYCKLHGLWKA